MLKRCECQVKNGVPIWNVVICIIAVIVVVVRRAVVVVIVGAVVLVIAVEKTAVNLVKTKRTSICIDMKTALNVSLMLLNGRDKALILVRSILEVKSLRHQH
jgi:hypothetical protein